MYHFFKLSLTILNFYAASIFAVHYCDGSLLVRSNNVDGEC